MTAMQKHGIKLFIIGGLIAAAVWRIEPASTQYSTVRHADARHFRWP